MVVIETERLTLRPLSPDDLDAYLELQNQPEVARFTMAIERPAAVRRLDEMAAEWEEHGYGAMAVLERSDGRFLGRSGLKLWPQFGETEVGWSLRVQEWGHGYASEAGRAVLEWGFANFSFPYITAMIAPQNVRSLRVAQRLGFEPLREEELLGLPVVVHAIKHPPARAPGA